MKYSEMPIGVQIYTVREDFEADPPATLKKVKELGYNGVEFFSPVYQKDPVFLKEQLELNGLDCYGVLTGWHDLQPENIETTLEFNRKLGNRSIAIGSLNKNLTKDKDTLYWCIDYFKLLLKQLKAEGFTMGYHNHAADFEKVDGKTIWDHIFENTPQDFNMVLDTGNAAAGGGDSLAIIRKYPGRQEWMHIKPYTKTFSWGAGYDTMVGEDDFDWPELIRACVELGGCKVLTIEYGRRLCYQPFYGAYLCYNRLKSILEGMD